MGGARASQRSRPTYRGINGNIGVSAQGGGVGFPASSARDGVRFSQSESEKKRSTCHEAIKAK